jgi:hypothetical protein
MPRPNLKENAVLLPNTQPDSVPFLLTRPTALMTSDAIGDDAETTEIPASRSVPPHAPPPAVVTTEHELPSVIVDAWSTELRPNASVSGLTGGPSGELGHRPSGVDSLLSASETLDFPLPQSSASSGPVIPVTPLPSEEDPLRAETELTRIGGHVGRRSARRARVRALIIAAVAAVTAAGGTFVGLKVFHVSGGALGAALHVVR